MAKRTDKNVIYEKIKKYLRVLKDNNLNYKKVYLYGSYTKGNFTDDSDIDLAIVSDDFSGDIIEDSLLLMKLRRQVDLRIEPHPFLSSEFFMDDPFVKNIIKTGEKIEE